VRVNAPASSSENKGGRPLHVRVSRAEGRRAGEESGAEVASDGRCRVSARGSRRKLQRVGILVRSVEPIQRFSMGRSRRDDIRHAARESKGLCHLETRWPSSAATPLTAFVLQRNGRTLDVEPLSGEQPEEKKRVIDEEDHCSRICPRVAWQQKSRTLSKRGESMGSHPSVAALLGSRVLPRSERQ
jgi:hypothetical protein